ncbi:hypothetical protein PYH69_11500 [Mammaliicoccus lentus]|uniref:Uncharacterized protein n=1 Tax=Mammaliicoccus lentus TaxID=42858 RepID=A0AAX3W1X6_MAMLE|nr:hypothetical protein [Mammaliicoccus lentus]WHI59336.1 hypothetical protein PYH69_11500 [Mammaliicoccus lentus]
MKKSYFIATYAPLGYLLTMSFFTAIIGWMLNSFNYWMRHNELNEPKEVLSLSNSIKNIAEMSLTISGWLIWLWLLILSIEFFYRLKDKSLVLYLKSIKTTMSLRGFLFQKQIKTENQSLHGAQTPLEDTVVKEFNRAIGKSIVDIKRQSIRIFVKIPKSQQAQHMLKEKEAHMMKEIERRNNSYYFTKPDWTKYGLWIEGTKR